ncbi:MAG: sulfatase [Planctomycetota bacterium]|nr:sulfatase [Planctomycetota bacterium]
MFTTDEASARPRAGRGTRGENARRALAVGLGAAVALAAGGCGEAVEPRVNVLLVTLDTARADRLGCYGNERIDTPNLDALAREGVRFEQAFTPVPSTLPSHCSIMTGASPARHGVHDNGIYRLDGSFTTLAERLGEQDYRTAAFVAAFVLDRQFGLDQGFATYDDAMSAPLIARDIAALREADALTDEQKKWFAQQASPYQRRAEAVVDGALAWLAADDDEPFFLWVHAFDAHASYQAPGSFETLYDPDYAGSLDGELGSFYRAAGEHGWLPGGVPEREKAHMIARYDGELAYLDGELGRLFAALRADGRWDETLVIVVGDHGEGFGEHGQLWEHNGEIFDEVMRVPLITKRPGGRSAGSVVESLVRTIDLAPTVLEAVDASGWAELEGASLFDGDTLAPGAPRRILLQALRERQAWPSPHSWLGLRTAGEKLVLLCDESGAVTQTALFDLTADPSERRPAVAPADAARAAEWTAEAVALYAERMAAAGGRGWRGMDALTSDALLDLGYTGGAGEE